MRSTTFARSPWGFVLAIALIGAVPSIAIAVDLSVPGDSPTIQGAIDLAADGDQVIVAPGVYAETIDFLGKAITVRSSGGAPVTTIDGVFQGSVVTFANGEGLDSILEGFTILRGQIFGIDLNAGGAGIFVNNASPTIRNNIIRNNTASFNGAGIFCLDSSARIEGNEFRENSFNAPIADAPFGRGGGVCVRGGSVEVIRNVFIENSAFDLGGAIHFEDTFGSVARSNICLDNNGGFGGALSVTGFSNVTIENILAAGNTAVGHTSIAGPTGGFGGGLYFADASTVQVVGATIVGNDTLGGFQTAGGGGGIWTQTTMAVPPFVSNAIIRGNSAAGIFPQVHSGVFVDYSNVEGGSPIGSNNFDLDPNFVMGPDGEFYLAQVAAGQLADSPCLDAGDPLVTPLSGTTTRTDLAADTPPIDVGFHYWIGDFPFRRGDCNADGTVNIADAIFLLGQLFPSPTVTLSPILCQDACDGNDDGGVNIADAVAVLGSLFGTVTPLPPPTGACGSDPTPDGLSCVSSPGC